MRNQRSPDIERPNSPIAGHKIRKVALVVFILTLAASAIFFILDFISVYDWKDEVVETCLSVMLTCFLITLCTPALLSGKFAPAPHIGVICSIITLSFAAAVIWTGDSSERLLKMTFVFGIISVGLAYVCIIHMCSRAPFWLVMTADILMVALLSTVFKWIVSGAYGEKEGKVFASIGVVTIALSFLIPMLHVCNDGVESPPPPPEDATVEDIESPPQSSASFGDKDLPPPMSPDDRDLPTAYPVDTVVDFTEFVISDRKLS